MRFVNDNGALVFYRNGETVRIEAWGRIHFVSVPHDETKIHR